MRGWNVSTVLLLVLGSMHRNCLCMLSRWFLMKRLRLHPRTEVRLLRWVLSCTPFLLHVLQDPQESTFFSFENQNVDLFWSRQPSSDLPRVQPGLANPAGCRLFQAFVLCCDEGTVRSHGAPDPGMTVWKLAKREGLRLQKYQGSCVCKRRSLGTRPQPKGQLSTCTERRILMV